MLVPNVDIIAKLKKNKNVFIETGSFHGDGIQYALNHGFKKIYSIELDDERYNLCKKRFEKYDNVTIIKGDSSVELANLLKTINEECSFWLDAHYCGDGFAIAEKWSPIMAELEAIKKHSIKTHTILVDDYRCMDNKHIDEDTNKPIGFPGKDHLFDLLREINGKYSFKFFDGCQKNDIVAAYL